MGLESEITEEQALNRLRARIAYGRRIKDLADQFQVSIQFMSAVLSGKKKMTEPMLKSIGVRRSIVYIDCPERKTVDCESPG
jgi:hypothetical protein